MHEAFIPQAAAFQVFQLEKPTPEVPYIKGLLDPCSNSLAAPNIPAEILYDKQVYLSSHPLTFMSEDARSECRRF